MRTIDLNADVGEVPELASVEEELLEVVTSVNVACGGHAGDEASMERVVRAALARGVRLRIIVPGEYIDSQVTRRASRADWGELLRAGAQIHEFQPAMFHCKALIVDSQLVSVGSTNFDNRSFRLNDEANLNVYDAAFAQVVTGVFEQDLQRSRRVTFEHWAQRPWHEKLVEQVSSFFASQM